MDGYTLFFGAITGAIIVCGGAIALLASQIRASDRRIEALEKQARPEA